MRKLTIEEMHAVSGGFNVWAVVFSYSVAFTVGAISAAPFGPAAMIAGGLVYGVSIQVGV